MGQIHQLILDRGVEEAKARTIDRLERQCVETAFAVMSDAQQRVGIMHAGFAMTALGLSGGHCRGRRHGGPAPSLGSSGG